MRKAIEKLAEIKMELISFRKELSTRTAKIGDKTRLRGLMDRIKGVSEQTHGKPNDYGKRLSAIRESPSFEATSTSILRIIGVADLLIDELDLREEKRQVLEEPTRQAEKDSLKKEVVQSLSTKVFVVHGHNDTMKEAVARAIEKLGLEAVVLHEKSNQGDTLMEKLVRHSDVGFAVVLLSADDFGYSKKDGGAKARPRARQNVVLELGYFTGLLGRKRVVALFESAENFEGPSDFDGVVYHPYHAKQDDWKFKLAQELRDAGYRIDLNKLL